MRFGDVMVGLVLILGITLKFRKRIKFAMHYITVTMFIDLLMGLFRGAVFRHGGGALKQPIKDPTETPTSTLALMGRFPSLVSRFPTLMGVSPNLS